MPEQNLNPGALLDAMDTLMCEVDADPRAAEWARKVATRVVSAYLSALPAQPDTVNSVEELDQLPQESVIRSVKFGVVRERFDSGWLATGADGFDQSDDIAGKDHVVLYRPVEG